MRTAAACLAIAASTLSSPAPARPSLAFQQPASVSLPDSAAARVATAFIEMLNNPSPEAAGAFEEAHGAASRRATVTPAERATRAAELRRQWGSFTIDKVKASAAYSITLGVRVGTGQEIEMEFRMSTAEAGKLEAVVISSDGAAVKAEPVTPAIAAEVVEAACAALQRSYVFPEVADVMAASVRAKLKAGEYDTVGDERQLAQRLTDDLRAVSRDKHLRVRFAPREPRGGETIIGMGGDEMKRENYAFRKAELLPGNIGYLRFDRFIQEDAAKETASAALAFLANADAVIFDLRHNGGGSPDMIRYITTYLFDKPTHLNDMYDRNGTLVDEYWTLDDVPGRRFPNDLPVYVLTSSYTFSGAEEFSYNLQNLGRATLIGETTGGGAHPVRGERLNERFMMGVPHMRAQNPITHTNWEGKGVEPDIKTTAAEALDRAIAEARKAIDQRSTASDGNK